MQARMPFPAKRRIMSSVIMDMAMSPTEWLPRILWQILETAIEHSFRSGQHLL